jgi:AcrR family transcriptional regulator
MVGVAPNAAYKHLADRDELLAAVCAAAMNELAARMAAGIWPQFRALGSAAGRWLALDGRTPEITRG